MAGVGYSFHLGEIGAYVITVVIERGLSYLPAGASGVADKLSGQQDCLRSVRSQRALPDRDDFPTILHKLGDRGGVALAVGEELCLPELASGRGQPEVRAVGMGVPEAAVHEDRSTPPWQQKIGAAWQGFRMQTEPETLRPKS